ncbi:large ribosomal subunit protein bL21m [Gouania willdenowi]|nr:39S ribosomal protein L21, mitochondrial [Gouania willdenowi]
MAARCGSSGLWRTCRVINRLILGSVRTQSSVSGELVPQTSLSRPPWSDQVSHFSEAEEQKRHSVVVRTVNQLLQDRDYGRLFVVVHFAGRQWKVTDQDLILFENHVQAECGDRIRLEKVLLVGAENFTLVGRPLLGKDLVRVEATVIEKTESWPKVHMEFHKRRSFHRKKILIQPQTVLRINSIDLAPRLT